MQHGGGMPEVLGKHPDVALQGPEGARRSVQLSVYARRSSRPVRRRSSACSKAVSFASTKSDGAWAHDQLHPKRGLRPGAHASIGSVVWRSCARIGLAFVRRLLASRSRREVVDTELRCGSCRPWSRSSGPPAAVASASEPTSREPSDRPSLEGFARAEERLVATGTATFTELRDGVRVVVEVSGIPPGKHGVHVHEKGDCSAPDAKSAGEHFSPDGHPHPLPPQEPRHISDFGNVEVDDDGNGRLEIVAPHANLREGDRRSFRGRAIVVHGKPDDGSQPSGNSGPRIGCGEILRAPHRARADVTSRVAHAAA